MAWEVLTLEDVSRVGGVGLSEFDFRGFSDDRAVDYALLKTPNRVLVVPENLFYFMDSISKGWLEIPHGSADFADFTEQFGYSKKAQASMYNLLDEKIIEATWIAETGISSSGLTREVSAFTNKYDKGDKYASARVIGMHVPKKFQALRSNEFYPASSFI